MSSTGRATENCRERQTDGIGPKKNPKWCPTLDTWLLRKERKVLCDVRSGVLSTARLSFAGNHVRPHPLHAKGWDLDQKPHCLFLSHCCFPPKNRKGGLESSAVPDISSVQGQSRLGPTKAPMDHRGGTVVCGAWPRPHDAKTREHGS